MLTLVEAMRAEWGVSLHDALYTESLAAALALWPSLLARHGCDDSGDSYTDKARRRGKARTRAWLDERYVVA